MKKQTTTAIVDAAPVAAPVATTKKAVAAAPAATKKAVAAAPAATFEEDVATNLPVAPAKEELELPEVPEAPSKERLEAEMLLLDEQPIERYTPFAPAQWGEFGTFVAQATIVVAAIAAVGVAANWVDSYIRK